MRDNQYDDLCSAPKELWSIYHAAYTARVQSSFFGQSAESSGKAQQAKDSDTAQEDHRKKINNILNSVLNDPAMKSPSDSDELWSVIVTALSMYQKGYRQLAGKDLEIINLEIINLEIIHLEIINLRIINIVQREVDAIRLVAPEPVLLTATELRRKTDFSFINTRRFVNFLAVLRLSKMTPKLKNEGAEQASDLIVQSRTNLTAGEFIDRAKNFLGIDLGDFSHPEREIAIASSSRDFNETISKHLITSVLINRISDRLFNGLLSIVNNTGEQEEKRLQAIFMMVFLIGSNPPLVNGRGGAFVTDFMMQYLLQKNGFIPVRKNFLNLLEVELLYLYSQNNSAAWRGIFESYRAATEENQTNFMFHPVSSRPDSLLDFMRSHEELNSEARSGDSPAFSNCNKTFSELIGKLQEYSQAMSHTPFAPS